MKPVVFDSSAIIAALMGEPGEDKVRASVSDSALSSVNLAEVIGYFARRGNSQEDILTLLEPIPVEIVPFDSDLAATAGMLVKETRAAGLSLGDRACLALARSRDAQVLTADRAWLKLSKALAFDIALIR